jgi:hypothetical protein
MDGRGRWVVLAALAVALVFGARWLMRIADPDASLYARPPGNH